MQQERNIDITDYKNDETNKINMKVKETEETKLQSVSLESINEEQSKTN